MPMMQDSESDDFSESDYEEVDNENNSVCNLIEDDCSLIETVYYVCSHKSDSRETKRFIRRPKGMIIGFRAKGGSISETAEFVNCSHAAVVKVYRAWQNGTVQSQGRGKCGAPRAIDDRGERRLRRCVRADRRATVEQLTTKMNQGATKSVSQTTIQRTLLRLGLEADAWFIIYADYCSSTTKARICTKIQQLDVH
ncbi:transposable element Tcb1 transposase [Trichonephila clavipes]|nr:transposable element Tcb1 transposase [Trichonephila clavipes]